MIVYIETPKKSVQKDYYYQKENLAKPQDTS